MNKQPFYHYVNGLLFTATQPLSEEEFLDFLASSAKKAKELGILPDSFEIEIDGYEEPEPGDPSDLM